MSSRSLLEALVEHAAAHPDRLALGIVRRGRIQRGWTRHELLDRITTVAAAIAECPKRSRILLVYPEARIEFVAAFLGCLAARAIPVPVFPSANHRASDQRLREIVRNAAPTLALTMSSYAASARRHLGVSTESAFPIVSTDELGGMDFQVEFPDLDELAFVQYTSGSTGNPRGVCISHQNLVSNVVAQSKKFGTHQDSVCVSWLPLYHDMGLVGLLHALYLGFEFYLMSPRDFVARPADWPRLMSEVSATFSGTPNFGLDLAARNTPLSLIEELDLSCVEAIAVGAESVRAETLTRFAQRFAPARFRRQALRPSYGFAETTLMATACGNAADHYQMRVDVEALGHGRAVPSPSGTCVVSCGTPPPGHGVDIVHPTSRRALPAMKVGEVRVSGPSIMRGYWHGRNTLSTMPPSPSPSHLSGDLGFVDEAGRLYIVGRRKEIIIVRGVNYYPTDLERVAQTVPVVRPECVAAFSVDDGIEESVVVVAEIDRRRSLQPATGIAYDRRTSVGSSFESFRPSAPGTLGPVEVATEIRSKVFEHCGLQPVVVLVPPGTIPKTSSGKTRRLATRELFETSALATIHIGYPGRQTRKLSAVKLDVGGSGV